MGVALDSLYLVLVVVAPPTFHLRRQVLVLTDRYEAAVEGDAEKTEED